VRKEDAAESAEVRKIAARAVRRLNVLEWVILAAAAFLAMLAGALAALMLRTALELPFRPTWIVASLVLFIVPATFSYLRARRMETGRVERTPTTHSGGRRDGHGG
jgi:uncharacterized membrane protein